MILFNTSKGILTTIKEKVMSNVLKEKKTANLLLIALIFVLGIIFLLTAGNKIVGKSVSIASADFERIMGEHPAFKQAMVKFQRESEAVQKEFAKLGGESKVEDQQKLYMQLQQLAGQLQEEAMSKVLEDVQRIAKSKGYNYVLDKKSLLVGGRDITGEILSEMKEAEKPDEETSLLPMIPVK
jgi:outer membrane protein